MKSFDINEPRIQKRIIIENEMAFAFPSYMPITPGHTLICPKRIISNIDDLYEQEILAIFELHTRIKKSLTMSFDAKGFNCAWNQGKIAGQSVDHFHLHVVPRKESDTGITEYEPRKFLYRPGERPVTPEEELIQIAQLIKKNL